MINEHLVQSEGTVLIVDEVTADNISVAANSATSTTAVTITKSGYTAIGIVGWLISSASSNGANANWVVPNFIRYTSNTTASYVLRNVGSSAAKVKLILYILYKKN